VPRNSSRSSSNTWSLWWSSSNRSVAQSSGHSPNFNGCMCRCCCCFSCAVDQVVGGLSARRPGHCL